MNVVPEAEPLRQALYLMDGYPRTLGEGSFRSEGAADPVAKRRPGPREVLNTD